MAGIDCQDLLVEPFGFVQTPGPVMVNGIGEHCLNGQ